MNIYTVVSCDTVGTAHTFRALIVTVGSESRAMERYEAKFGKNPAAVVFQGFNRDNNIVKGIFNPVLLDRITEVDDGFIELFGEFTADL